MYITRLRSKHTAFDRAMNALDFRRIEKSGIVAKQRATRKHQLGQGLNAPGTNCPGAISHPASANKEALQALVTKVD